MAGDKRKYPRQDLAMDTIYFCQNQEDKSDRVYYPGTIVNTSKYGLGLRGNSPHEKYDHLWFEGIAGAKNPIPGVVQWVETQGDDYRIGVQLFYEIL